jgi:ABC-type multidrug transport system ATPase subunit
MTVLLTTQYLDEAEQLADRIEILHQSIRLLGSFIEDQSAASSEGGSEVS